MGGGNEGGHADTARLAAVVGEGWCETGEYRVEEYELGGRREEGMTWAWMNEYWGDRGASLVNRRALAERMNLRVKDLCVRVVC